MSKAAVDATIHDVSGVLDWIQLWETGSSVKSIDVLTGNKMEHA